MILIVVLSPRFDLGGRVLQRFEPVHVQALGAEPSVEGFDRRDVGKPVSGPAPGYEDHEVREDRVAARMITEEAEFRVVTSADVTTILSRTADEWRELRPHMVNLSEGKLSRSGHFKIDDESIADIIASIRTYAESSDKPRVMLHADGVLVSEKSALGYEGSVSLVAAPGRLSRLLPWETGAFEVIKNRLGLGRGLGDWWDGRFERFARPLGRPLWDDMKDCALKSSALDAGGGEMGGARIFAPALRALLASLPDGKTIGLHAVGRPKKTTTSFSHSAYRSTASHCCI